MLDIKPLQKFYKGFYITTPNGNNSFSYFERQNKSIYVPPLIEGLPVQLEISDKIAFSEVEDGVEKNIPGLKNFIYYRTNDKDIFLFDNHNHAFFFWMAAFLQNVLQPGLKLIHVDMHTDMHKPPFLFPFTLQQSFTLKDVFDYTNYTLHVACFIVPALRLGLFSDVEIIDSTLSFENTIPDKFVLDIDLDVFTPEMDYIGYDKKMDKIQRYIEKAELITIATSPFFMDQNRAIELIHIFFEKYKWF